MRVVQLIAIWPIVGEFDLREISQYWGSNHITLPMVLASIGFLVVVLGIFGGLRFYRTRRKHPKPNSIFHRLANECGLGVADEILLWRIARQQELPTPTTLLLSTRTLHYHARQYAKNLTRSRQKQVMSRVRSMRATLRHCHLTS